MTSHTIKDTGTRLSRCVTALLQDQPFFGNLTLRLPLRPDPTRQTIASDGKEIRFSPEWVADTEADLLKTALARIVMACALKHHTRRRDRDPQVWQLASQLVTHPLLQDAGFTLPEGAECWLDCSVEEAYGRLIDNGNPDQPSAAGNSPAGPDSGHDNDDPPDPDTQGDDGQPASSSSGPSFDPSGTGEILDAEARASVTEPLDHTIEEQAWDEAMHQAAQIARVQGNLPSTIRETVDNAHRSTLDWRSLLRRHLTDAASADYSWSSPNRRYIDSGLYLPSIRSEGLTELAIIIDTSASLPSRVLNEFWAEIREIATEIRPETLILLQVDTILQDTCEYAASDLPDNITLKGRGGTDFRPGFEWLYQHGRHPGCCLYLTDMECDSYPEHEPLFPVVWCNYGPVPDERCTEPWGERIDMRTT
ncbi:MAG: VWA-like domain-containing protein [Alphaproteobacteria bacterium]|nr:VWA-like domain-containing protein [Alphaproteobacteria bacterium]